MDVLNATYINLYIHASLVNRVQTLLSMSRNYLLASTAMTMNATNTAGAKYILIVYL